MLRAGNLLLSATADWHAGALGLELLGPRLTVTQSSRVLAAGAGLETVTAGGTTTRSKLAECSDWAVSKNPSVCLISTKLIMRSCYVEILSFNSGIWYYNTSSLSLLIQCSCWRLSVPREGSSSVWVWRWTSKSLYNMGFSFILIIILIVFVVWKFARY